MAPRAAELTAVYELLRRRVTEGAVGRRDGLAVLRGQGLHAWIALTVAVPRNTPWAQPVSSAGPDAAAGTHDRIAASLDPSLLSVCIDMLLSRLSDTHQVEETQ